MLMLNLCFKVKQQTVAQRKLMAVVRESNTNESLNDSLEVIWNN